MGLFGVAGLSGFFWFAWCFRVPLCWAGYFCQMIQK